MKSVCPILDRKTEVDRKSFHRNEWLLKQCQETGFIFLADPPDYSELESEFAWEETSEVERIRRYSEEPIFSRVSDFFKKAKSIAFPRRNKIASLVLDVTQDMNQPESICLLDVGCGSGDLIIEVCERLAKKGRSFIPLGIEISKNLASSAADKVNRLGGKVLSANAIAGVSELKHDSVDVMIMSSFLEHECQPLSLLQKLHPMLKLDGAIVLKVPNFACWNRIIRGRKWCGFRFPDHVNYFTPRTLRILAEESGYTVSRQNFIDKFPFSDNMYAILTKRAQQRG